MKRLVKVNSERRGGKCLKRVSKRGFSSREKSLNCGNSETFSHKSSMIEQLLFSFLPTLLAWSNG
jgi:hypothetical protein